MAHEPNTREEFRFFLKDHIRMRIDFSRTDQSQGLPPPPIQKPCPEDGTRIPLTPVGEWKGIQPVSVEEAIRRRVSHRKYRSDPLGVDELSFLLWATQGIRQVFPSGSALRTVPSAGARHAFETYVCALNVTDLRPGVYRYLPLDHELTLESEMPDLAQRLVVGSRGQRFTGGSAVCLVWTALPYRMEWRYDLASAKVIAQDSGHLCQNLYLACEAIGAGTCAIAAYDQDAMDALVHVDGVDEFVIYLAPVGKI